MSPPKPSAARITESTSMGVRSVSVTFGSLIAPSTRASTAMGSTSQNRVRQCATLSTSPDTVGPSAGAAAMTMEMLPIILPRSCGGTRVITVVMSSGIMTPVPEACTMRPTSSSSKPGASAAMSVPAANSPIAPRKICRVVKRRSSQPEIGMTIAMVSMKEVCSHCPVEGSTCSSSRIGESATPRIVSLRMTTKAEKRMR